MITPPIPLDEKERLKELQNYHILESAPEQTFDQITTLAASICGTTISLVSLIDEKRQWFKSCFGVSISETPRDISFCGHAILGDDVFIVPDARLDSRFSDNPAVTGELQVCFYAGAPLITPSGKRIGTLCVVDSQPKNLNESQISTLKSLARHVVDLFELRKKNSELEVLSAQYRDVQKMSKTGGWGLDATTGQISWSDEIYEIYQLSRDSKPALSDCLLFYAPHDRERMSRLYQNSLVTGESFDNEFELTDSTGKAKWVRIIGKSLRNADGKIQKLLGTFQDISEQKKTELQLTEAQSIAKTGSWYYNLLTHEQTWSEEHYKIFEIPSPQSKEKLHTLYREKIHPDDLKELDLLLARALESGTPFVYDHRVVFPDGRIKYVQGISKVIFNEQGSPVAISGTCRDRTSDVETELKNLMLLTSMSEGMVVLNENGIVSYNTAALSILKLSAEELTGQSKTPKGWELIRENGERYPFKEHPAVIALRTCERIPSVKMGIRLPNEEVRWITINSVPIKDNEGRRVIATFSDITDLIQANEENQLIMDTVGIGVWKLNLVTGEHIWDRSMFELYELDPSTFTYNIEAWEKLLTKESRQTYSDDSQRIAEGANSFQNTIEIITPGGKRKFIGTRGQVIRNSEGNPVKLYGVNWDRTKEVELEKSLEKERVKSLHNAKLASIGQLAAGVGHEINNPLAILSGLITITDQMVMNNYDKVIIKDKFHKMEGSVSRISNIVKGLRTFARSDSDEITSFDPFELIKETSDLLKELYLRDEVSFSVDLCRVPATIKGNRGRLQQVLVNLISNAKDASEGRPGRAVKVFAEIKNEQLEIAIRDNGCGIEVQLREKIFEPFFTTKDVNKGTGIGLSLVNTIVKEHAGKIDFTSEVGVGTEFKIYLPVLVEATPDSPKSSKNSSAGKTKGKILIVDDEDDLREVMKEILLLTFSEVLTATSVTDALRILNEQEIDLIISDIKMPIIDGFSFLRMIRQNQRLATKPVIFITGGIDMSLAEEKIVNEDANGFFTKPVKIADLVKKVQDLLSAP